MSLDVLPPQVLKVLENWYWGTWLDESWWLQLFIFYGVYLIIACQILMYSSFYLLWAGVLFGIFLSFYGLELLTAFLWLAESVIVYISILFLFYLNVYSHKNKINRKLNNLNYGHMIFVSFFCTVYFVFPAEMEFFLPVEFNIFPLWDDFFEAIWYLNMNDAYGLYISFYHVNPPEFLSIGTLLLYGSVLCVNINKLNRSFKISSYTDLLSIFNFFKDFVNFIFLRKQNLNDQARAEAATRRFCRKNLKL